MKFDMLAPYKIVLSISCNVPQLQTIGLGILSGDSSAWVGSKHNPKGWFTPSQDWELWTREVVSQCSDILADAGVFEALRVTFGWIPSKAKETYSNTFITPNSEFELSLVKMLDVFGLPILEEFL